MYQTTSQDYTCAMWFVTSMSIILRRVCSLFWWYAPRKYIYLFAGVLIVYSMYLFAGYFIFGIEDDFSRRQPIPAPHFPDVDHIIFHKEDRLPPIKAGERKNNISLIESKKSARPELLQFPSIIEKPDKEWIKHRKTFLNNTKVRRVLLYNYQHEGSSLLQSLLNHDRRAVVFPQALDPLVSSVFGYPSGSLPLDLLYYWNSSPRSPAGVEIDATTSFLSDMLSCKIQSLPSEFIYHSSLMESLAFKTLPACIGRAPGRNNAAPEGTNNCKKYLIPHCGYADASHRDISIADEHACGAIIRALNKIELKKKSPFEVYSEVDVDVRPFLSDMDKLESFMKHKKCINSFEEIARDCIDFGRRICRHYQIRVAAVNRLSMKAMESLLNAMPDLHVFYFVRDPRWEAYRRAASSKIAWFSSKPRPEKEARMLCARMSTDFITLRSLKNNFPGVFHTLRYEDLIEDLSKESSRVYSFLGLAPPSSLEAWKLEALDTEVSCRDEFGPYRCPPKVYNDAWRQNVASKDLFHVMTAICQDVLEAWKYEL